MSTRSHAQIARATSEEVSNYYQNARKQDVDRDWIAIMAIRAFVYAILAVADAIGREQS